MKKIMLFIAALFVFCIVPTANTQAMLRKVPDKGSIVSSPPNAVLSVFNQRKISDMDVELSSRVLKDNILSYDLQKPRETRIAQSGKSTTTPSTGKTNPHVHRSGHGRSTMGDNVTEKYGEEDAEENEENEVYGDDSAIQYNDGLRNSAAGYNEDL